MEIAFIILFSSAVGCYFVHLYQDYRKKQIEEARKNDSKALGYMVKDLTTPKKRTYKRRAGV